MGQQLDSLTPRTQEGPDRLVGAFLLRVSGKQPAEGFHR